MSDFIYLFIYLFIHLGLPCQADIPVDGILNGAVILPPCVIDGVPKRITWSILNNDTYIATIISGSTKVDLRTEFKDRLDLNASNGSLKIKNLQRKDGMNYKVNIISSTKQCNEVVNLQIIERVQIQKIPESGECQFTLKCLVPNHSHFNYVWNRADDPSVRGSTLEVDIRLKKKQSFTCVASNNVTTSTATVTEHCSNTANVDWK
ncbi:hypothetical protein AOXY_G33658 [Acipenser oxyrinchus oxyrinchus]|uniref:Ig-like domain-containing protein n=1 Tax=Acipenser oxyrinchus oxyrinchus TaxID=40147 RepID=A0AAD8FPK5_ACIOX|nr:hypothetical protein AOXY_G33658 [Acipenser oxyrinchus oxyrinchus]